MTSDARRRVRDDVAADPWWGEPQQTLADAEFLARPVPTRTTPRRRRRAPRTRTGIGWRILRLLAAPVRATWRRMVGSERVRRLAIRLAVVAFVLTFLACSVGVILINNVVIGRTAELGELDDRRRELRRDNALLGAESAQLSAPPVIFRRAERDLGMVRTSSLPKFIWLDPASHTLTPWQKQRRSELIRAARGRAAEPTTATKPAATDAAAKGTR